MLDFQFLEGSVAIIIFYGILIKRNYKAVALPSAQLHTSIEVLPAIRHYFRILRVSPQKAIRSSHWIGFRLVRLGILHTENLAHKCVFRSSFSALFLQFIWCGSSDKSQMCCVPGCPGDGDAWANATRGELTWIESLAWRKVIDDGGGRREGVSYPWDTRWTVVKICPAREPQSEMLAAGIEKLLRHKPHSGWPTFARRRKCICRDLLTAI